MHYQTPHAALVRLYAAFLVALLLVGCTTAPPQPQNVQQALVVADRNFTAVVATANDLREQGVLTAETQQRLTPLINEGSRKLTLAWQAYRLGDIATAEDQLAAVSEVMRELRATLPEQQGGTL